jgi:hypothetical protein
MASPLPLLSADSPTMKSVPNPTDDLDRPFKPSERTYQVHFIDKSALACGYYQNRISANKECQRHVMRLSAVTVGLNLSDATTLPYSGIGSLFFGADNVSLY